MENCKGLFANLEQKYETDFISSYSQSNNVSHSFTLFRLNDEIHQIYEILDSFVRLWSLETLKRCKLLISKIILCVGNEFFLPQVITNAFNARPTFFECKAFIFCNHLTMDNSELKEMYLHPISLKCGMACHAESSGAMA